MDPAQMLQRCPSSPTVGTGWLADWRLTFGAEDYGWEGSLATIVPEPGGRVFVVLYDVPVFDEQQLDSWEGADAGLYTKLRMRIRTAQDRPELAWLYVLRAYEGGLPSARYLGVIADAAERSGAPAEYVRELRLRPCRSVAQ